MFTKILLNLKSNIKHWLVNAGLCFREAKQRICIARALIKDPNIIIFDDSLSALDTETEQNILENIDRKISNATSIIITHRESSAQKRTKIINLTEINNSVTA
jgi:ATP-binding cassette subfamily B protein